MPFPPSTNKLFRNVPKKGRVKTREYKLYEQDFNWWLASKKAEIDEARAWLKKNTVKSLTLLFKAPKAKYYTVTGGIKRIDISNRCKAAEDLLCNVLGLDDSIFFEVILRKVVVDTSQESVDALLKP